MWSAATVLVCALEVLGRGAGSLPPIALLDVRQGEDVIYLITSTPTFARAQAAAYRCGDREALITLAASWCTRSRTCGTAPPKSRRTPGSCSR